MFLHIGLLYEGQIHDTLLGRVVSPVASMSFNLLNMFSKRYDKSSEAGRYPEEQNMGIGPQSVH